MSAAATGGILGLFWLLAAKVCGQQQQSTPLSCCFQCHPTCASRSSFPPVPALTRPWELHLLGHLRSSQALSRPFWVHVPGSGLLFPGVCSPGWCHAVTAGTGRGWERELKA